MVSKKIGMGLFLCLAQSHLTKPDLSVSRTGRALQTQKLEGEQRSHGSGKVWLFGGGVTLLGSSGVGLTCEKGRRKPSTSPATPWSVPTEGCNPKRGPFRNTHGALFLLGHLGPTLGVLFGALVSLGGRKDSVISEPFQTWRPKIGDAPQTGFGVPLGFPFSPGKASPKKCNPTPHQGATT